MRRTALKGGRAGADWLRMSAVAETRASTAALDPAVDAAIEAQRERLRVRIWGRNLWSAVLIGGAFIVAAASILAFLPTHRSASPLVVAMFVAAYALASRVSFEVGSGEAVPTTLVLVPMLFVLPLHIVPLCVAGALLLRDLPRFARVGLQGEFLRLVNSWHAVGPVLVLGLAGERAPSFRDAPIYAGALAAQFAFDFVSCAARERLALGIAPATLLRFISWAWLVDAGLAPIGLVIAIVAFGHAFSSLIALPLIGLMAFFSRERRARINHALELSRAYRGTALLLGDVLEADDAYTGSHSRDVVSLVLDVCDALGLSPAERRDAEFAALLHDVGKIKIPGEIINKPGPLDADERAIITTHTIEGERMLSRVGGLLGQVGGIVRSCHENWDGTGYPDRLAGEEIPLTARIVSCCDAYSAITTDRSYRPGRSHAEAVAELRRVSGTQFDPRVVDALVRVLAYLSAASTSPAARTPSLAPPSMKP